MGCENIYLSQYTHDINALMAFLSLAFLCMAFFLRREKEGEFINFGILSITLIFFLFFSASNFYFSSNADLSGYPAVKNLSALFFAMGLLCFLKNIEILKKTLFIIFVLAGVHAGVGILQQFVPSLLHQPEKFSFTSSSFFHNPNFYSGYLVIHIPIGFYLMSQCRNYEERVPLGGIWIMIWLALGFSGSPGGQLFAGVQALAMFAYLLKKKDFFHLKILAGTIFLTLVTYFGLVNILNPTPQTSSEAVTSLLVRRPWIWEHLENRLMYWSGAWSIFKENWLLGSGLWTFIELYPQTGLKYTPPHAHNMYLQTAMETGLVGFGLLMACLTVLFRTLVHIFKKASTDVAELNFYIAVSLFGFLLQNLIEYNWLTSNFIYFFVFLIVAVEVLNRETGENKKWVSLPFSKEIFPKWVVLSMVLGAFTIIQYYRYSRIISYDIPLSHSVEEVFANAERAKNLCSRCGKPYYLSGIIHLETFRQFKNLQELTLAEKDIKELIRRNPNSMGNFLVLGEIKNLQGNFNEASKYYEIAMKDPRYKVSALAGIKSLEKRRGGRRPGKS